MDYEVVQLEAKKYAKFIVRGHVQKAVGNFGQSFGLWT